MTKVLSLGYEYEHDYTLIGINSTLDDYRLAYLLNSELQVNLKREANDLDFTEKNCSFTLYNYECNITFTSWSLFANKQIFISQTKEETNLFKQASQISYFINEKKGIDYFLKIHGGIESDTLKILLDNIKKIKGIIATYSIDPYTLKSKDFLIF
ncbi:MAG: IPExxxVDY family protein [Aureibaculum sp.]|jgi:hypothetical protein